MSLKSFHIVFISASILLALGIGGWELNNYSSPGGTRGDLLSGAASLMAAVALAVYGVYFLKKLKHISYL